jgi:hypothetical protein
MKKACLLFCIALVGIYLGFGHGQPSHRSSSGPLKDTLNSTKYIGIGMSDDSMFALTLPQGDSIISLATYWKYRRAYHIQIDTNPKRLGVIDSSFTIRTSEALLKYPTEKTLDFLNNNATGKWFGIYQGFQKDLNLYFVHSWSYGEFGIGENEIIDAAANIGYRVPARSDGGYEALPLVSPHHKYIAYYDNIVGPGADDFPEGYIIIVKVPKNGNQAIFSHYAGIKRQNWTIKELVWVGDTALAMRIDPDAKNTMFFEGHAQRDTNAYVRVSLPR